MSHLLKRLRDQTASQAREIMRNSLGMFETLSSDALRPHRLPGVVHLLLSIPLVPRGWYRLELTSEPSSSVREEVVEVDDEVVTCMVTWRLADKVYDGRASRCLTNLNIHHGNDTVSDATASAAVRGPARTHCRL